MERIIAAEPQKFLGGVSYDTPNIFRAWVYARQRESAGGTDIDRKTRYDDSWGWGREVNMPKVLKNTKQGRPRKRAVRSSTAHLDRFIEEATVDCYNESEETIGIFTMLEENLAVPFTTTLLGVEVTVERVDLNDADEIVAVCRRGRERLRVPVIDLPLPEPEPKGAEWIDAYRRWARWK